MSCKMFRIVLFHIKLLPDHGAGVQRHLSSRYWVKIDVKQHTAKRLTRHTACHVMLLLVVVARCSCKPQTELIYVQL